MAKTLLAVTVVPLMALSVAGAAIAAPSSTGDPTQILTAGLQGSLGSAIGPDGALYVTEAVAGRVSRVDLRTGRTSTYASGLPRRVLPGIGGAMDIAFLRGRAYVLVTLVSPDVGGTAIDGVYRVDGPQTATVVADIGEWSMAHPPVPPFFIPTGVQYAMQPYRDGFLVTDGHHNRILGISRRGDVTEVFAFPNIVPTGLATRGNTIFVAEAGPAPHLPQDGKVAAVTTRRHPARVVASGAPLLVDVEFGTHHRLYALSQGHFTPGQAEGSPADPNTGGLYRANANGTLTPVAAGLDQPTSLEIIGDTAYIVTLTGDVVMIHHIDRAHAAYH
jgi:sugar lactone lactonase YvrE